MCEISMSKHNDLIEDLKKIEHYAEVLPLIESSQKFILGDVNLFPIPKEYRQEIRLPYPVTLLEYCVDTDSGQKKKEMILCCDGDDNMAHFVPFQLSSITGKWIAIDMAINVNVDDATDFNIQEATTGRKWSPEMVYKITEHYIGIVRLFLAVLNCKNVSSETQYPPVALQKKRLKKKKKPFHSFHVLKLNSNIANKRKDNHRGSHASPRVHFRRGHIRILPSGMSTWVTACLVGNKKNGFVRKEYAVGM